MGDIVFYTAALVVLLLISAFFSGSEAALFSLSRSQLRSLRDGSASGRVALRLLERPRRVLITILIGNLSVNIFTTSAATAVALNLFGERGAGYSFLLMSALIMLFGEILPKAFALHGSRRFAQAVAFPLSFLHGLFLPIRAPLTIITDRVLESLRRRLGTARRPYSWEELLTAVRIGRREGAVAPFEYEILSHVLEFRHKVVREIMTPSIQVVAAPVTASRDELVQLFASSGLSRVPIREESSDDVLGILHVKDMVDPAAARSEDDLRALVREVFFIQENAPIVELYAALQARKLHVAVVLDEHGSFAGVVTIEDILEQLVGEIRDAREPRTQPFQLLDDTRIVVAGTMELDHFNEVFDTALRDDEHETVAGFVLGVLGRIPREGETVVAQGLSFHVISALPNRIRKLRVEKL
ncbi:MAG TPA: hemolysin family protein [Candidatus Krumholzibacteria bacterium]|nr:hemolysin family protein [Candidatus Krumholzibacteria bacterium]